MTTKRGESQYQRSGSNRIDTKIEIQTANRMNGQKIRERERERTEESQTETTLRQRHIERDDYSVPALATTSWFYNIDGILLQSTQ